MDTDTATRTASPTRLRSGDWGVRVNGAAAPGDTVEVVTRAGQTWTTTVTRVVWTDGDVTLAETTPREDRVVEATAIAEVATGFHYAHGTIWKVQRSQGGNLYAKELQTPAGGGKGHFEYVGKAPLAFLSDSTVLTAEQAAAYGHAHGICGICGATLSDPESVARGIGPVCATRV